MSRPARRSNTPSRPATPTCSQSSLPTMPREVRGRNAITTFWDDICSRAMTHKIDINATEGDRLTFSQSCTYPGGAKVFCVALVELAGGKIAHQTIVQAWDE